MAGSILKLPLVSKGPIDIGEETWIGYRCIILSGVQLGRNCVVAAGSVVTKSFPEYSVIGGNPARLIKSMAPGEWNDPEMPFQVKRHAASEH
jgi:lipopolysaccharide O-acetyltransferase